MHKLNVEHLHDYQSQKLKYKSLISYCRVLCSGSDNMNSCRLVPNTEKVVKVQKFLSFPMQGNGALQTGHKVILKMNKYSVWWILKHQWICLLFLIYINYTKEGHCDISIRLYNVLWSNSSLSFTKIIRNFSCDLFSCAS